MKNKEELQNEICNLKMNLRMARGCCEELRIENETLKVLEKQYCDRLGELARRCDTVMPFITNYHRTVHVPPEVIAAANEIMEYVEAVRPD